MPTSAFLGVGWYKLSSRPPIVEIWAVSERFHFFGVKMGVARHFLEQHDIYIRERGKRGGTLPNVKKVLKLPKHLESSKKCANFAQSNDGRPTKRQQTHRLRKFMNF